MTPTLSPAERSKLAKICALLGSPVDGERAAAVAAASRFLKDRNISWADALQPPKVEHKLPELGTWRTTCRHLLERPGDLRHWELGFVRDLPKFSRLSVKQRYVLREISDRVLGPEQR